MRIFISALLMSLTLGASAHAQDYGLLAGLSESNGASAQPGVSTGGVFGFRLGAVAAFPLTDSFKFRTGLIFTERHVNVTTAAGVKGTGHFDYIDIPAMLQFNFTDSFGVFGGIIAAVNIDHSFDGGLSDSSIEGFSPILQVGINGTFDNMYGIEAYYEMGLTQIDDYVKNFSVFGVNFVYWL
jgi:hypothetical protein